MDPLALIFTCNSHGVCPPLLNTVQELGGDGWVKDLFLLKKLLPLAASDAFKQRVFRVKMVRTTTHTHTPCDPLAHVSLEPRACVYVSLNCVYPIGEQEEFCGVP